MQHAPEDMNALLDALIEAVTKARADNDRKAARRTGVFSHPKFPSVTAPSFPQYVGRTKLDAETLARVMNIDEE